MSWRAKDNHPLDELQKALLLEIAARAKPDEAFYLLQIVQWASEANLPWAFQILKALPIRDVAPQMLEQVLQALVPYGERKIEPPCEIARHVLIQVVPVPDLDLFHHSREWDVLTERYPRSIYELLRERIAYGASNKAADNYSPIPSGYHQHLHLAALVREPDYPAICEDLWGLVSDPSRPERYAWMRLFQAVVFEHQSLWPPRMLNAITNAQGDDALLWLAELLNFEGSLIIFHFPEITRAFLIRAKSLGGDQLCQEMRVKLYSGCGPQSRSYSGGILDRELDYVEAEAAKAAEAHASDELLGPFYRWIVDVEQKDRLMHKMDAEASMAALD